MKSEKKKKHHHHHHHHHHQHQSANQLESPIKLPIELSLLESDIIPQPEPATLSPTYTLSPARYESPPRVDHGSPRGSSSSALSSPTSPKSPTSPTSPTLSHRKPNEASDSVAHFQEQDVLSSQGNSSTSSNNSDKEEARTIFPMYFASDQSAMGSGLDRPRTESLPALDFPYLSSCSSSSSSSSSANPFSKTPSEHSILSGGACSWGPTGVLGSASSASQSSTSSPGRGIFSSKHGSPEPNQLSSMQQLPASSKNASKEKTAYGASSLTRGAKCFLVKERKVAKSKRTSTTSNRNLVLVTDINGISLVQPFTEVLVAHYPFKEIKLWKSSATFFYFLWYPPGSKKDSQGVPFLYETVVGDEIMKALEESVQKALIRRRQGLLEP